MNILVINAGSSSLKFQLINMKNEEVISKGVCERIGLTDPIFTYSNCQESYEIESGSIVNHTDAVNVLIETLMDNHIGVIKEVDEIQAVGHRIAHGGEQCTSSFIIDEKTIKIIEDNIELAPLHNSANLSGIYACKKVMPDLPMVGVPDTAFHHTIPEHAYIYPIPYEYYEKYKIRKYGFHGTSHQFVGKEAAKLLDKPIESLKIVTCHLGNGSSICAINQGESVENSMGFTPLDGIAMGTRSGSIDPAIPLFLMEKEGISSGEINNVLNKKSGLLGLSGVSNDFRDIHQASENGNKRALLAEDVYAYRVRYCIGAYAAIMGGIDAWYLQLVSVKGTPICVRKS